MTKSSEKTTIFYMSKILETVDNEKNDQNWLDQYCQLPKNKLRMELHKIVLNIAVKIKQERKKKKISLDKLSLATGISKTALIRIEKGSGYNINTFIEVCFALGVSPEISFGEIEV